MSSDLQKYDIAHFSCVIDLWVHRAGHIVTILITVFYLYVYVI